MSESHSTDFARQLELAWAAGFFDGEGCTGLDLDKRSRRSYVRVTVTQVICGPLERFKAAVSGLGRVEGPYPRPCPTHQPLYRFRACGHEARQILGLLWPYLCEPKREQATKVLRAEQNRGRARNGSKTHCPKGHAYDAANTYVGQGGRHCRTCGAEYAMRKRKAKAQGREKASHCPQGHEYTLENSGYSTGDLRYCRTCKREKNRLRRKRLKERQSG